MISIQSSDTDPYLLILGSPYIPKGQHSQAVKVKGHFASEGVLIACAYSRPTGNRLAHEDTLCCGRVFVLPEIFTEMEFLKRSYFPIFCWLHDFIPATDANTSKVKHMRWFLQNSQRQKWLKSMKSVLGMYELNQDLIPLMNFYFTKAFERFISLIFFFLEEGHISLKFTATIKFIEGIKIPSRAFSCLFLKVSF